MSRGTFKLDPLELPQEQPAKVAKVLDHPAPRATRFIVTIYGDVVAPRGGTLWMGTLISVCAVHGISESLVRTAVSRLVGGGQLEGDRIGRKSYYRLTEASSRDFARVGQLFYDPPSAPQGWYVAIGHRPDSVGWARLGSQAAIAPARADLDRPAGALMRADTYSGLQDLRAFAADSWPVSEAAKAYRAFIERFDVLSDTVAELPGQLALALRLQAIHQYRQAVLSDPRLPIDALPSDWPGQDAARLFARLYLQLAPQSDAQIARSFADARGVLMAETDQTKARLKSLSKTATA